MGKTKDLSEKCLRVLRPNLELGEVEIARGRCDYFPFLAGVPNGSAYTFLVVTNDRIMWTDFLGPERVYDVRFSDLRSFSEGSYNTAGWCSSITVQPSAWKASHPSGTDPPAGTCLPPRDPWTEQRPSLNSADV